MDPRGASCSHRPHWAVQHLARRAVGSAHERGAAGAGAARLAAVAVYIYAAPPLRPRRRWPLPPPRVSMTITQLAARVLAWSLTLSLILLRIGCTCVFTGIFPGITPLIVQI